MSSGSRYILVVDDDERIRRMLLRCLSDEGYRVSATKDSRGMHQHLASGEVDLVLLDVVLPGEDGFELAREVRAQSPNVGIIMLTGRGDMIDRVVGLELGADDYIAKPFHIRELAARVKSVLRRLQGARVPPAGGAEGQAFRFDGWSFDAGRRQLTAPSGEIVPLTSGEFDLLHALLGNAGRVLTRNRLMDLTKGRDWDGFDRAVDAQVVRLRKKIEPDPKRPIFIRSVRGAGYVFAARVGT